MSMESAEQPTPKKKGAGLVSILKTVAIILGIVVFLTTVLSNLVLVYVIFAPDNMPKPFYLMYTNPGQTAPAGAENPQSSGEQHANTPTQAPTKEGGESSGHGTPLDIMPGQGILLDTGTKIVNLAEPGGRKFIRTNVVLEFAPDDPVYFEEEEASSGGEGETKSPRELYIEEFNATLNARLPVINDIIITLLSTKDFQAVYTSEGKEILRQEIMQAVNTRLQGYKVIYVYFTEFVMQ